MANYLLKFKGKYRILPQLDQSTNDFVREWDGSLCDNDIYISCQNGNMIGLYGHINGSKTVWLHAYIPSKGRGHNIVNALKEKNIAIDMYQETDEEVCFVFKASDIEEVATLMKAKTLGADISPFSSKNLPKANISLSPEKIKEYKEITANVSKDNLLLIHTVTMNFLNDILQISQAKKVKDFDYKKDIKLKCMARQVKEYIDFMGYWDEYMKYLRKEINK